MKAELPKNGIVGKNRRRGKHDALGCQQMHSMNFLGDGNGKKRRRRNFRPRGKKEGGSLELDLEKREVPRSSCIFLSRSELLLSPPSSILHFSFTVGSPLLHFPPFPQNVVRFSAFPSSSFRRPHILLLLVPFGGGKWKLEEEF
jgi:hypothetical protein